MSCPRCGRPAAIARPTCLYCGAPLPEGTVPPAPVPDEPAPATADRALVVLDVRGAEELLLAQALGVSAYDARQRVSGSPWQLHRALPAAQAEEEAARLRRAGLAVRVVAGAEAAERGRPLSVRGGEGDAAGRLVLHTEAEAVGVTPGSLFLIVRGPITREYQTSPDVKRMRTATLEGGHRIHLHRASDPRPLEIDPLAFDFGDAVMPSLSSLLTIFGWLEQAAPGTAADDGFRRLAPALAPARAQAAGRLSAADALRAPRRGRAGDGPVVLDNVEQFRAYSAWRAAVERPSPAD